MHETRERMLATATQSVKLRIHYPVPDRPLPGLLYLHGGGWTLLDLDTHDRIMREYAAATDWAVIGVDLPRAPEAPFPQALETCAEVLAALPVCAAQWGLLSRPLALCGDSSGANLALAAALKHRDAGLSTPDALILAYGVYDCDLSRGSYAALGRPPFVLSAERMAWFWDQYCPDPCDRFDPLASPMRADLRGLPPVLLIAAGQDVLRDENVALMARLVEAEVAVSLDHYPRAPHGFLEALALSDESGMAIRRAGRWLNETVAGALKGRAA
jgi:acetyl esterase